MIGLHAVTAIIVIVSLAFAALAALVRIVRGPTILDRMVAADMLLTTLMLSIGSDMVLRGHTEGIPIMVAIAATAVFATVVVSRYVRRRSALSSNEQPVELNSSDNGVSHV